MDPQNQENPQKSERLWIAPLIFSIIAIPFYVLLWFVVVIGSVHGGGNSVHGTVAELLIPKLIEIFLVYFVVIWGSYILSKRSLIRKKHLIACCILFLPLPIYLGIYTSYRYDGIQRNLLGKTKFELISEEPLLSHSGQEIGIKVVYTVQFPEAFMYETPSYERDGTPELPRLFGRPSGKDTTTPESSYGTIRDFKQVINPEPKKKSFYSKEFSRELVDYYFQADTTYTVRTESTLGLLLIDEGYGVTNPDDPLCKLPAIGSFENYLRLNRNYSYLSEEDKKAHLTNFEKEYRDLITFTTTPGESRTYDMTLEKFNYDSNHNYYNIATKNTYNPQAWLTNTDNDSTYPFCTSGI